MQDVDDLLNVAVTWRGNKYNVEMNSQSPLKELGDELVKLTDVKTDTMRLIVPQNSNNKGSKLLYPFSKEHSHLSLLEACITEGRTIRMMGVSEFEVDKVLENAKVNHRIAGFDEEEKRIRHRVLYRPQRSLQLPQGPYIFGDFRTLKLPGIELNPPASEALKRMHMLAADPGIVGIMNKHRWRVGIMTEMAPVGYVGVSPKCILGFNKNHGEEISLRLRTDDLKGFRKYEMIKKTLLHELAHMVYSEHDANFYALDKQLNQEAESLDWTKSKGHTLSGFRLEEKNEDDIEVDSISVPQKLGGSTLDRLVSARASSVAAAYLRLANTSTASEVPEGPDRVEATNSTKENKDVQQTQNYHELDAYENSFNQSKYEPDPDENSFDQNKYEPDPDENSNQNKHEADHNENSFDQNKYEPDPDDDLDISKYEPDPDDSNSGQPQVMEVITSGIQPSKDHDDVGAAQTILGEGNVGLPDKTDPLVSRIMEDQTNQKQNFEVHVPNKSISNKVLQFEPDPDDHLMHPLEMLSMQIDEPDPDDQELQRIQDPVTAICSRLQKAIEVLRAGVNPADAASTLETLFKIIRNVIEHPNEVKFKRLRKANPIIQKNIAKHKAAKDILEMIGFNEEVSLNEVGAEEAYLVLKRNDPGLFWLAKSSLEAYNFSRV